MHVDQPVAINAIKTSSKCYLETFYLVLQNYDIDLRYFQTDTTFKLWKSLELGFI